MRKKTSSTRTKNMLEPSIQLWKFHAPRQLYGLRVAMLNVCSVAKVIVSPSWIPRVAGSQLDRTEVCSDDTHVRVDKTIMDGVDDAFPTLGKFQLPDPVGDLCKGKSFAQQFRISQMADSKVYGKFILKAPKAPKIESSCQELRSYRIRCGVWTLATCRWTLGCTAICEYGVAFCWVIRSH